MSWKVLVALSLLLGFGLGAAQTQESNAQSPDKGAAEVSSMSALERSTLSLDIAVSTYYELKAWAASKGLPVDGTASELRARLYSYYGLQAPSATAPSSGLSVESASSFQYFTMEEGDRVVSFQGPVVLTMRTEDGFTHKIQADKVVFDRDKNLVKATGGVVYQRSGAGRQDEFRGETIIVDLASYTGVFVDGTYDMAPSGNGQRSISFDFERLARRSEDLTVLEDARITACDAEPPHYHIKAKKVWLFGNGDWALSSATLYVGSVPVLWLPFFYYPSDELIFHPVIGYRSREGAYVQTTTYLLGERKKDEGSSSSSSLSLLESSGGAKKRSGVFLRRIPSQDGTTESAQKDRLALMADIYSALGVYLGLSGHFETKVLSGLDFTLSAAESRSLFLESNGYYSPFDYANSYGSTWNSSNFLGTSLPFRFGIDLTYKRSLNIAGGKASVSLAFPLYSDPYYLQDFSRRAESSSILSAFSGNTTTVSKTSSLTQSLSSSLNWSAGGTERAKLLSSVNLSKLGAQMAWKTKSQSTSGLTTVQKRLLAVDPQRDFFYPDDLKFLDAALSLSGRLTSLQLGSTRSEPAAEAEGQEAPADPSGSVSGGAALASTLDWTFSGSASGDEKFLSSSWSTPSDIDASPSYVLLGWKGSLGLSSDNRLYGDVLDLKTSLSLTAQDQLRPYLYDERSSPTTVHPYRLADYAYRSASSGLSSSLSFSPFKSGSAFASSSLSYTIGGTLFSYGYSGLSGSGVDVSPLYATTWIGWNSDTVTTHAATATLGYLSPAKISHRLSLQANLPPQLEKYSAAYALSSGLVKASLQGAVSRASTDADILPSSLTGSLSLGGSPYPLLKSDWSWDFDAGEPSSGVTSLAYLWATASFTAKKAKGYSFSSGTWTLDGSYYFRSYEASLALGPSLSLRDGALRLGTTASATAASEKEGTGQMAKASGLNLQINPKLSYSQNFVKYTESTLAASMDLALTSKDGTSLSFSAASANKSAWRYWPALFPSSTGFDPTDYYKNFFVDLGESLSIWDAAALKKSLFKLQSLSLKLSQDLHDWNLEAALSMSPTLYTPDTGRPYYQLDFSFSLSVTWKDIPELKTSVDYEDGAFQDD